MTLGAGMAADVPFGCGCMQAQLKEAQGATAAEAAKLAELQQRLDGVEAERSAAQDALAASRQEAATAQEQLAEARKQVRCCSGQDGHSAAQSFGGSAAQRQHADCAGNSKRSQLSGCNRNCVHV
jgi:hypothetical protein